MFPGDFMTLDMLTQLGGSGAREASDDGPFTHMQTSNVDAKPNTKAIPKNPLDGRNTPYFPGMLASASVRNHALRLV
jgi:hypothetical protein